MDQNRWSRGDVVTVDLGERGTFRRQVLDSDYDEDSGRYTATLGPVVEPLKPIELVMPISDAMRRAIGEHDVLGPIHEALRSLPLTSGPVVYYDTEDEMPPEMRERLRAERTESARVKAETGRRHRAVVDRLDGPLRAVAEMHGPFVDDMLGNRVTCMGCTYNDEGYDGGPGAWPCPTWELLESS